MPEITPGCWVTTRFGKAVCVATSPHRHRVGPPEHLAGPDGVCHCACEDDSCRDARLIEFRYRATRRSDGKEIWVANGDLSGDGHWSVRFLRPATRFTARVLALRGPYGEG